MITCIQMMCIRWNIKGTLFNLIRSWNIIYISSPMHTMWRTTQIFALESSHTRPKENIETKSLENCTSKQNRLTAWKYQETTNIYWINKYDCCIFRIDVLHLIRCVVWCSFVKCCSIWKRFSHELKMCFVWNGKQSEGGREMAQLSLHLRTVSCTQLGRSVWEWVSEFNLSRRPQCARSHLNSINRCICT